MAEEKGLRFSEGVVTLGSDSGDVAISVDTASKKLVGMVGNAEVFRADSSGLHTKTGKPGTVNLGLTNITTAGAATYTAAQIATGLITRDPAGANRTDVMPDAADIIAGSPALAKDGDVLKFYLVNTADAAETITLGGSPTGVTYANAGQTIAQNESALILVRRTSSTAVTVYIVGA